MSSPKHISELDKTPGTVIYLNGAARHVCKPFIPMCLRALTVHTTKIGILGTRCSNLYILLTLLNWFDMRGLGFISV